MPTNIEVVTLQLTDAQQKALRKMALRNSDKSANEVASNLFGSVLKSRVKAIGNSIAEEAGEKYDTATSAGFEPPMERAEFVAKAREDWRLLLADLQ